MAPRSHKSANGPALDSEVLQLRTELAARMAETEWLKAHYEQHLREAMASLERLKSAPAASLPAPVDRTAENEELHRLRLEVQRLQAAEIRYLDRIAELKEKAALSIAALGTSQ
jgi:hypothetical protein